MTVTLVPDLDPDLDLDLAVGLGGNFMAPENNPIEEGGVHLGNDAHVKGGML